ncbi:hypothetical protein [Gordonia sp. CPCC 205333]|uniref:hypothetical protein n=1 Tax=Gordonia sp. CPCC 205333 TaxID=3140790 RepID=UPI003AF33B39
MIGARAGVRCGGLISADGDDLRYEREATVNDGGDSGGAVFVVAPGGQAALIGLQQGAQRR